MSNHMAKSSVDSKDTFFMPVLITLGCLTGVMVIAFVAYMFWYRRLHLRRLDRTYGWHVDPEFQMHPYVPSRRGSCQSYDSARDGFDTTPVYGSSRVEDFGSFVAFPILSGTDTAPLSVAKEPGIGNKKRTPSVDTLEAMPIPEASKTVPTPVHAQGRGLQKEEQAQLSEDIMGPFTLADDDDEPEPAMFVNQREGIWGSELEKL